MHTRRDLKVSRPCSNVALLLVSALWLISAECACAQEIDPRSGASVAFSENAAPSTESSLAERQETLRRALAENPRDAHGWLQLGILDGQSERFEAAEQDLRRSIALDAAQPEAHYLLGLSLIVNPRNKLDWPQAIAEFRTALKLRPDYAAAYTYLGAGLSATGHDTEAIQALETAVRLAPRSASAQFNYGLVLGSVGRNKDAAAAYRIAIASRQEFAEAHSALGKLLLLTGDRTGADQELRKAITMNPDLEDAHYAFGRLLKAQGNAAAATNEFEIARTLGQREADGIASSQKSNAAMRQAAAGDLEGALESLRTAVSLRPDYGVPHYNLGLVLADRGQWDQAIAQLSQAASLMSSQAGPWLELGRVLRRQGHLAEGVKCLQWAAKLDPTEKVMQELRAAAPRDLSSGPALRPEFGVRGDNVEAFESYGAELDRQGDAWGAIGMMLRGLSLSPSSVKLRLSLARAYGKVGQTSRALEEYRKVTIEDPGNAEARSRLAS